MLRIFFTLCFVVSLLSVSLVAQTPQQRDPAEENPIIEELKAIADDETVARFVSATEAMDSGRYEEADSLYTEVLKKVPDFGPALRRLGYTYGHLGKRKEGLALTAKALEKDRSIGNLGARASMLVYSGSPDFVPSPAEVKEAESLAREAWQKSGSADDDAGFLLAETLLMSKKYDEFVSLAHTLKTKFPDSGAAAYYEAMALAANEDLNAAEAEIARAKTLGAPAEAFTQLETGIQQARDDAFFGLGRFRGYFSIAVGIVAVWAVGLVALFVIGWYLSKKTLRSIETSDPNDITGQALSLLKRFYRGVVSIAGIYYYISQPVVIFLIILFTGAVVVGFLWVGRIPIYFVLLLIFAGGASIYHMLRTLVTRPKIEDPGRALTEAEAPALWQLVRNVAETINTRPVTEIRITQGTDLAVYERGSFRAKIADRADRILILGAAVLNDFDQNAFRAVVAHEYGHFSNRDTAGGDIAHRVNVDIMRVVEAMVSSETNTIYNVSFHFLRLFHFLFRRITHGASRLQEVLADRVAAFHFGADSFQEGLRHVIRRELEFTRLADKEIGSALSSNRAFSNLYDLEIGDAADRASVEEEFSRTLEQETSEDDTHPSPKDRFRYIEGARSAQVEHLRGKVWDLFADREAITNEMNALIEKLVRPSYSSADSTLGL